MRNAIKELLRGLELTHDFLVMRQASIIFVDREVNLIPRVTGSIPL